MLNESTLIGYVLAALVLILGFAATVLKISRPIQDLNINIIKLTTVMSFFSKEQTSLKCIVEKHTEALDQVHTEIATLTTRVEDFEKRGQLQ